MEQITITKRDGTQILAYSKAPLISPTTATQNTMLMSDDTVSLTLVSSDVLSFGKGDKINIGGYEYKIRTTPTRTLLSDNNFRYDLTFHGALYDLMKCQYRDADIHGNSNRVIFELTYTLKEFVWVIVWNMQRACPGEWDFDDENCPDTEPMTISFNKQNCLNVLQSLCGKDRYNLDFLITQSEGVKTIHIGHFGSVITPPGGADYFEYGKGNGLYKLTEKKVDDRSVVTRLWVEGGTTNIRSGYRGFCERLQLPYPKRLNKHRHVLSDGTVIEPQTEQIGLESDSERYFEDQVLAAAVGTEEDTQIFDQCYPHRTGTVSALGETVYEFIDSSMDFDLAAKNNDGETLYLIPGTSAKITFITGLLAGTEFELAGYDHETKKFRLLKYTDERGLSVPTEDSEAFRVSVGDRYKITDIVFPQTYEEDAEEDLWYAGLDAFLTAKQPRAQYELTLDRSYFLDNLPADSDQPFFKVGDYIPVRDTRFGIQKNIRISKVSRNLLVKHDYTLTLSDTTSIAVVTQKLIEVLETNRIIETNQIKDLARLRRAWRFTEELREMVYDPDGYFDTDNIRPASIDTNMLSVGSKSQQFVLSGVILQANYGGNKNVFSASAGVLSHLTIAEDSVVHWNMAAAQVTLTSNNGYYVFAKCPKEGANGVWYVTQEQLRVENESDPNNYYFQVGIIGSTNGTFRDFITTYGFTRINGNTITTGKIQSAGGQSYLDLDGNQFRVGDSAKYLAWNINNDGKLRLKGTLVQSQAGTEAPLLCNRGAYSNQARYYYGDLVTHNGQTWWMSNTTVEFISGYAPADDSSYWTVFAAKGASGLSALFADLTNEMEGIACDKDGKALQAVSVTTTAAIYYGTTKLSLYSISVSGLATGMTESHSTSTGLITITIPKGTTVPTNLPITITVASTLDHADTRTLTLTLAGVRSGKVYSLLPSVSVVKKNKAGQFNVNTVSCSQLCNGSPTSDGTITYSLDGGVTEHSYSSPIAVTDITSTLTFLLRITIDGESVLCDRETIPLVEDGTDGTNAKLLRIEASSLYFSYPPDASTPNETEIVLTAVVQNIPGATYVWKYRRAGQPDFTTISGATSSTLTITAAQIATYFSTAKTCEFSVSSGGLEDIVSIVRLYGGTSAISAFLTNTSHIFPAGRTSAYASSDTFQVLAFKGITPVTPIIGTVAGCPTGMTATVDGTTITVVVGNNLTTTSGRLTIPISVEGQSFVLYYSWSLSLTGTQGKSPRGPKLWVQGTSDYQGRSDDVGDFYDIVYLIVNNKPEYYYCEYATYGNYTAGGTSPDSNPCWVGGANFSFVATELFLAQEAKIQNLYVDKILTTNETSPKAVIQIAENQMTVSNSDGDVKVKIHTGTITSGSGSATYSLQTRSTNLYDPSGTRQGTENLNLGSITITSENNIVNVPSFTIAQVISQAASGLRELWVGYVLKYGNIIIEQGALSRAGNTMSKTIASRQISMPIGTYGIVLQITYKFESSNSGTIATVSATPGSTSNSINYTTQISEIATDGMRFRYGTEGLAADSSGFRVITGGSEYQVLGSGALNNLTPAKKQILCTAYPSSLDSDALYLKVSQA